MKACKVLQPGPLSTIQDSGRRGYYAEGIPEGMAFDSHALKLGNFLLGNDLHAAGIEMLWSGASLEFLQETWIAITGADLGAKIDDKPVPLWQTLSVKHGQKLIFSSRKNGLRAYLLFAGGLDVPLFLGSRSTYLFLERGGHQGRKLERGDMLSTLPADPKISPRRISPHRQPKYDMPLSIRVVLGLQYELFTDSSLKQFESEPWTVSQESNRVGVRLSGPLLEFKKRFEAGMEEMGGKDPSNIPTEGNPLGSIQCPSGSQLIVIGPDGPCEGGYAKIGTIISADLHLLGQAMPGDQIKFKSITLEEAYKELHRQKSVLESPDTLESL
ncbi:biotin-dependent carboxyltransferase family protein [Thermodesulfobacteriota bacterium]